jgi:hypothetical protein
VSGKRLLLIGAGVYIGGAILLHAIFGSEGENEEFQPQEEFRLEPWIEIHIGGLDLSINRAVFYLFLACALTAGAMVYVARRTSPTTRSRAETCPSRWRPSGFRSWPRSSSSSGSRT